MKMMRVGLITAMVLLAQGLGDTANAAESTQLVPGDLSAREQQVRQLAAEYKLFEPTAYAYHFIEKDIKDWADRSLSEDALRAEFRARKTIRYLVNLMEYREATKDGKLDAGMLSYWAERLQQVQDPAIIEQELSKVLARRQQQEDLKIQTSNLSAIRAPKQIERIANDYGLLAPNAYAWTFKEGDINWYATQGMMEAELRQEFQAKATVRKLAAKTGFSLQGLVKALDAGELSHWAKKLQDGSLSEERMEAIMRRKALEQL